jgi:Skp family chaperone for outer membrane proteins
MSEHRIWRWALVGSVALVGAGLLRATAPTADARRAAAAASPVATIDLNGVLSTLDERAVREKELQSLIQDQQKKLEDMQKALKQAQDDLKILPERSKEWDAKREDVIRQAMRLEGEEKLAKAIIEEKRKKLSLDLFGKIRDAAGRYAQREGLALVLNSDAAVEIPIDIPEAQAQSAMVGRRILFRADAADISQAVSQMMNTEFKAR